MTPRWKARVKERLAENKHNGVIPLDQVQLAVAVGASDKSAITKMFKATASKLVPEVCRVLQIASPMRERTEPDDLDRLTESWGTEKRNNVAEALRRLGF